MRKCRRRRCLRYEQRQHIERMTVESHHADVAIARVDTCDAQAGIVQWGLPSRIDTEAAVVPLGGVCRPVDARELIVDDVDLHALTDERAEQFVDEQLAMSSVLRVRGVAVSQ